VCGCLRNLKIFGFELDLQKHKGIREPRLVGEEYLDLVDEFMSAINFRWPSSLVQFEDFESSKAGPLLERYRNKYRMFNDDIQGTGKENKTKKKGFLMIVQRGCDACWCDVSCQDFGIKHSRRAHSLCGSRGCR
jgi:hypothetical protein